MISVACVLKSGGYYAADWVARLQGAVETHLQAPHRFVCLSDVPVPCERIALQTDWPGWWAKIELFRAGLFRGPVLYFDLDNVIVGPLDDMIRTAPGMTMVRDFAGGDRGWHNSSVMSWLGDMSCVHRFLADRPHVLMQTYQRTRDGRIGDQALTEDVLCETGLAVGTFTPGRVVSYKWAARDGLPEGASVVQFHGKPKPDQVSADWVRRAWAA